MLTTTYYLVPWYATIHKVSHFFKVGWLTWPSLNLHIASYLIPENAIQKLPSARMDQRCQVWCSFFIQVSRIAHSCIFEVLFFFWHFHKNNIFQTSITFGQCFMSSQHRTQSDPYKSYSFVSCYPTPASFHFLCYDFTNFILLPLVRLFFMFA